MKMISPLAITISRQMGSGGPYLGCQVPTLSRHEALVLRPAPI